MMDTHKTTWDAHIGKISVAKDHMNLKQPNAALPHVASYRAGPRQRVFEKEKADQMIKAGVAILATTEWASPLVFVPRKNRRLRLCVDYCHVNAVTVRNSYSISMMD